MQTLAALRDSLADALDVPTLEAADAPLRWQFNSYLIRAQAQLYRQYRLEALKGWWQIPTLANVNTYAIPQTNTGTWAASTPKTFNQVVFDGTNYQMVVMAGTTGPTAPTWNATVGGNTTDGSVTWFNMGPTPPAALNARQIEEVWVVYNMAWLSMDKGIPSQGYTLIAPMYPRRWNLTGNYLQMWPTPDNVYPVMVKGYQALAPFASDTDVTTVDDELVLLFAIAKAKAVRRLPDAPMALAEAREYLNALRAESHGSRRYVPGSGAGVVRPMPIIVNPEVG